MKIEIFQVTTSRKKDHIVNSYKCRQKLSKEVMFAVERENDIHGITEKFSRQGDFKRYLKYYEKLVAGMALDDDFVQL